MKVVYAEQNDNLDAVCWRNYGRSSGIVEMVLEANPHLAALDAILPHGTPITLPDITTPQNTTQTIQLWD